MKRTIAVIRHIGIEGLGTIEEVIKARGLSYTFINTWKDPIPQDTDGFSAVVILGGPMGVSEQDIYPFIKSELSFIRKAHAAQVPVIGVCLGSQMIAEALGGRVYKGGIKEIGWYDVQWTPDAVKDRLLGTVCSRKETAGGMKVFQWHGDTFDLPDGAVVLAGSARYKNQAFCIGTIYGLQFHVEVTEDDIMNWVHEYRAELDTLKTTIDPDAILRDTRVHIQQLNQASKDIFTAFFSAL